jgi:hypothetical protein
LDISGWSLQFAYGWGNGDLRPLSSAPIFGAGSWHSIFGDAVLYLGRLNVFGMDRIAVSDAVFFCIPPQTLTESEFAIT